MSEEKSAKHNVIIRLISPTEITYAQAVFKLASSFDNDALEDNGLLIIGYDSGDIETETTAQKKKGDSRLAQLAARSPGVIGDFMALFKGRSPRDLYIMFCGLTLASILAYKWLIRLLTGTF